jgi:hypothetical protein
MLGLRSFLGHHHREYHGSSESVRPLSAVAFYASSFFHPFFVEVPIMCTRMALPIGSAGFGPIGGAA